MNRDFYITDEEYKIAANNGVNAKNLEQRIRSYGWSKEKAMTKPVKKQTDRSRWSKVAKENGIGYGTFMSRIHLYGWDVEKAATTPSLGRSRQSKINVERSREKFHKHRVIPNEILELAKENGIAYPTLYSRVKKGMDPIEAAKKKPSEFYIERFRKKKKGVV